MWEKRATRAAGTSGKNQVSEDLSDALIIRSRGRLNSRGGSFGNYANRFGGNERDWWLLKSNPSVFLRCIAGYRFAKYKTDPVNGAGGRTRTDTYLRTRDFESRASTIPPHPRPSSCRMAIPFRQPSDWRQPALKSGLKTRIRAGNFWLIAAGLVQLWPVFRHV